MCTTDIEDAVDILGSVKMSHYHEQSLHPQKGTCSEGVSKRPAPLLRSPCESLTSTALCRVLRYESRSKTTRDEVMHEA